MDTYTDVLYLVITRFFFNELPMFKKLVEFTT